MAARSPDGSRRSGLLRCLCAAVLLAIPNVNAGASPDCSFALVLSGGGARGLAQIGVLRAFEEERLRPDLVVGTSMGAVIAALYAAGNSSAQIEQFARQINWETVFANSAQRPKLLVSQKNEPVDYLVELRFGPNLKPILPSSVSHGQQVYDQVVKALAPAQYRAGGNFDSLAIPLRVVATDLLTGRSIVIARGNIASALRASSGVPLAFSPVFRDSTLLMDGGLTANIPVAPALASSCSVVVAVNVTSPLWQLEQLDGPVRLMEQVIAIGIAARKQDEEARADIVIRPDLAGFTNTNFTGIDTLIARGYAAARELIPRIRELVPADTVAVAADALPRPVRWLVADSVLAMRLDSALAADSSDTLTRETITRAVNSVGVRLRRPYMHAGAVVSGDSATTVDLDLGRVTGIQVSGNNHTSTRLVTRAVAIKPGDLLRDRSIPLAMSTLYATGLFHTVNIDLDSSGILRIFVEEKPYLRARVGLRFDDYYLGEGYAEPAYENLFGLGINAVLHLQYGLRREKYAIELAGNQLFSPWWASNLSVQGYIAREAIVKREETPDTADTTGDRHIITYDEQSLRKTGVVLQLGTEIGKIAMLSGGVRFERFKSYATGGSLLADGLYGRQFRYLTGSLTVDNLDRWPFATRGNRHHVTVGGSHDALSQTASFLKVDGYFSYYFTIAKRHTICPQISLGWANHSLPIVEKFYVGGMPAEERYREMGVYNYLPFMGLKPRTLTGDILALARLSYQARLWRKTYAQATIDWGTTWQERDFEWDAGVLADQLGAAPLGVGLGLAYDSPVGPIRVTWARLLRQVRDPEQQISIDPENRFYLSVGYDF